MAEAKKYKRGFTLGKFMPPHKGHIYMIESALQQVEELIVLVCTVEREPIPGTLRYNWMKQIFPNVKLIHVTDDVPSYPHEHPEFWPIWKKLFKKYLPSDTEVFFSSENYGAEVAELLTISYENIDIERVKVPVSANVIRENPFQHWNYIPEAVKPYYVKRVVLTGPESTGKTTLSKLLAEHYNTVWVEEYGREHFVKKDGKIKLDDIDQIGKRQIEIEKEGAAKANKILICDTDLIVTKVWSGIYFETCPPWIIQEIENRKYDLFLLMDKDIPWVDDGTREFPHLRSLHFKRIKDELDQRELPYKVISGPYAERLPQAVKWIDKVLFNK